MERKLTFPTGKTVNMIFRKRRKKNEEPMEITLRKQTIPYKESTQFLGMALVNRLNWKVHIDRVRAKRALNTVNYTTQLPQIDLKKLNSIHREDIKYIYRRL